MTQSPPVAEVLSAEVLEPVQASAWQCAGRVVTYHGAQFADRCVKCNEPSDGKPLKRSLVWHEPWIYVLILAGLLIYVVVAMVVRRTARIHVGLCARHRRLRRLGILIGWLSVLAGIGLFVAAGVAEEGGLAVVGLLVLTAGTIAGAMMARVVWPTRIDPPYVVLKGAGKPFMDTLQSVQYPVR